MRRQLGTLFGLVLLALSIPSSATAQSSGARLRFIHAASGLSAVDVFVDGTRVLSQVPYASISDYLNLPTGTRRVAVTATEQNEDAAVIVAEATIEAGKTYSFAAIGLPDRASALYTDDVGAPAAGKARVRVIHLSPDAPGADVRVVNGPTLIQNLAFSEASSYLEVDQGTYDLQVAAVGENSAFFQLPNTKLTAGTIYDVVAVGRLANIQAVVAATSPQDVGEAGRGVAPENGPAQMMPNSGINTSRQSVLMSVALLVLVCGLVLCCIAYRHARDGNSDGADEGYVLPNDISLS
jgi:hypothetical protein